MCGFVKPCGYMTTSGFTTTSKLLYDLQWACCTCSIDLVQFLYIVVHSLQRPGPPGSIQGGGAVRVQNKAGCY